MSSIQFSNRTLASRWFTGDVTDVGLEIDMHHIDTVQPFAFDADLRAAERAARAAAAGFFDRLLQATADHHQLTIFLDSNPWECRCDLVYLQQVLRSQRAVFHDAPVCATPVNNAGEQVEPIDLCVNGAEAVFHQQLRCTDGESVASADEQPVAIAFRQNHFRLQSLQPGWTFGMCSR